jgi:aspartate aminotransferase
MEATMLSLASGYGDFAVPPVALEAATAALASAEARHAPLEVSPAAGQPDLRAALAQRYRQRGALGLGAEQGGDNGRR